MVYVYILQSEIDKNLYIGLTNDLERRFQQHNLGKVTSTKHRIPFRLIYKEQHFSRKDAREREKYFKSGFGREIIKKLILNQ